MDVVRKLEVALDAVQSALSPRRRRERAQRARAEAEFDRRYGVDTAASNPPGNHRLTLRLKSGSYQAVDPRVDFADLLRPLIRSFKDFVFVDLGSGKGRAVMLASRLPFREVMGFEFSQNLHKTAVKNIRLWSQLESG